MSNQRQLRGADGEDLAVRTLAGLGYRVLERNYRTPLGEIDIVARDGETVCFIEVKTRSSDRRGLPQEALDRRKQRQLTKAALAYLKAKKLIDCRARFDVVSILLGTPPKIELFKNAFELSVEYA